MKLHDKIHTVASKANFILHILLFVFIVIVGFLPFCEEKTFYTYFNGFFGKPYLILLIFVLSCVTAFFAIKRPIFCLLTFALTFTFFMIIVFPYSFESFFVGFTSKLFDTTMSEYKIGFSLMNYASNIIFVDLIFALYSVFGRFIIVIYSFKKNGDL